MADPVLEWIVVWRFRFDETTRRFFWRFCLWRVAVQGIVNRKWRERRRLAGNGPSESPREIENEFAAQAAATGRLFVRNRSALYFDLSHPLAGRRLRQVLAMDGRLRQ